MEAEKETPEQEKARLEMQQHARDLGAALDYALPEGVGFALAVFDFGEKGSDASEHQANVVAGDG